ncbi:unnamed protein product [Mycetohabitans rhizoxinica HKI 454]|uniref:Uncharacterized protein n=1 Tax=Mycetohabitans rhizoxinica (strain DSM 19002 / CIP 109453 / HKI 454) TaxID=882378 RepID=E5AQB3_MYCRK|nr:unnamed protein product [Mycetohabitans rhizoxinica HKI 454]
MPAMPSHRPVADIERRLLDAHRHRQAKHELVERMLGPA